MREDAQRVSEEDVEGSSRRDTAKRSTLLAYASRILPRNNVPFARHAGRSLKAARTAHHVLGPEGVAHCGRSCQRCPAIDTGVQCHDREAKKTVFLAFLSRPRIGVGTARRRKVDDLKPF